MTLKAVTSLASLAAGGVVVAVPGLTGNPNAVDAIYVYPIGALLAIVVLGSLDMDASRLN